MAAIPPEITNVRMVEKQFFRSVNHFTQLYKIHVPDVAGQIFPYNIHKTYRELSKIFGSNSLRLIIARDQNKICLATVKEYDIGYHNLYYMPVLPLVRLLKSKRQKPAGRLLLSVFAYLYMVQHIPFYSDEDSYLFGCHECIENYISDIEDEYEKEYYLEIMSEFRMAEYWGKRVQKMLRHPYTLECLRSRVEQFHPQSFEDNTLLEIGRKTIALSEKYPAKCIWEEMPRRFMHPQNDGRDDEPFISGEQVISFNWSTRGDHFHYLIDHINCDMQEIDETDLPIALQLFDKPQKKEQHDFSFVEQTFDLLSSLCDYLY